MPAAPFDLKTILEQLEYDIGMTPAALARALCVNMRTLQRWRDGASMPRAAGRTRLQTLLDLRDRLLATFATPAAAQTWLKSSNRLLGGLTPLEALQVGRAEAIDRALEALDSGIFV